MSTDHPGKMRISREQDRPSSLHLISWNVAGRVGCLDKQIAALTQYKPDVIALQEVRSKTARPLREGLDRIGLGHCIDSFDLVPDPSLLKGPRQYGELIASRWPLQSLPPSGFPVPWTERVLSALIDSPWGCIEIHTTHIPPGSSNGWMKIEMLEGIFTRLACDSKHPRILCGDFNTPQKELPDGYIVTWGQSILSNGEIAGKRRWRGSAGRAGTDARWDSGERSVLEGLSKFDLSDVYRSLNGYEVEEFSHYVHGKQGRRFDHIFASGSLNAVRCGYLHFLREEGLSDHSAIEALFEPSRRA